MQIGIWLTGTLRATGFATRVSAMVQAYTEAGHTVDLFHLRYPNELELPDEIRGRLREYRVVVMPPPSKLSHLHLLAPTQVDCYKAAALLRDSLPVAKYDVVQAETTNTWPIVREIPANRRVLVFHDDDCVRIKRLASAGPNPLKRYVRMVTAAKYGYWQWRMGAQADEAWFVSPVEMERAKAAQPEMKAKLVPNGAADNFYQVPANAQSAGPVVAFVGPTTYDANVQGVTWFLEEVWPGVLDQVPGAVLRLVGPGWYELIGARDNILTPGFVADLPKELTKARVIVAPLLGGGGTKLKVIEAMAAARPVVVTPIAAEGIPSSRGMAVATTPQSFASAIVRYLRDAGVAGAHGLENRKAVEHLKWSTIWNEALRTVSVDKI